MEDPHHYIIPSLVEEKIYIGKMCRQYWVRAVIFSPLLWRTGKLGKMISQVNGAVTKKWEENGFNFVSNSNILRKHLCKDGIYLTDEGTNIFRRNIIDYIRHFILK